MHCSLKSCPYNDDCYHKDKAEFCALIRDENDSAGNVDDSTVLEAPILD